MIAFLRCDGIVFLQDSKINDGGRRFLSWVADLMAALSNTAAVSCGTETAPGWVPEAVTAALRRGLDFALFALPTKTLETNRFSYLEDRVWWVGYRYSATTALTGGVGGLFGTLGLCVELPVRTCVMLRSMVAIAGVYGEDLRDTSVRLECLTSDPGEEICP